MIRVQSLKHTIITQFALILAPVVVVLAFQSWDGLQRAEALQKLHRAHALATDARERYSLFDGLLASLGPEAAPGEATVGTLKDARDKVAALARFTGSPAFEGTARMMSEMADAMEKDPGPQTLPALQERINIVRVALQQVQTEYDTKLDEAIKTMAERTALSTWAAIIVSVLALGLALIFIVRLILGLSGPLNLAVSIADRVAEGRTVEEREFNIRGDIGDLIRSLGRMYRNLNIYKTEAALSRRGLEEKFQQLEQSQASLSEAQRLAQMGNWSWDLVKNEVQWSDELYRILGYPPGGCKAGLDTLLALVDAREHDTLRDHMRELLKAPGHVSLDAQIITPDGLYRANHIQASSTANDSGKVVRLYGAVHDITERKQAEEKMHYLAMYDTLTGLPNRQLFNQQLEKNVLRARRNHEHMAVMFIDLDRFKRINDTLGHAIGDSLLREVSTRLNHSLRTTDQLARDGVPDPLGRVARLAGDEFTVTLDTLREPQDAARVAQRIVAEVSRPFMLGGQEVVVTTSVGIAVFPDDGEEAEILLKNADAAMYQAKSLGRNTYQFFAGEMNSAAVERLKLESELRYAQERGQLSLHYQIKVDARSGGIAGLEALMRWNHPELGMVPPVRFIPIAEEIGLIVQLGEWVIDTTCRQLRLWREAGLAAVPVAVNLASPSFRQPDLVQRVSASLQKNSVPPGHLCIEATESILMRDADATMATLKALRALGVKLSIDDFGTGYSSLSYLRRFPIDQLKIDRSFVNEVAINSDDAAIVAAIASLARSLSLEVVAEGIETVEQARLLLQQGCYIMQGYFFAKPVPADEITQRLQEGVQFNERILRSMRGTS